MTPDQEITALVPDANGLLDAELRRVRDRLVVVTPHGWVNPKSRTVHKVGLHSFQLRGTAYHEAALKAGSFAPGTDVRLAREPDNPHDPNAIAVYSEHATRKAGYVPGSQAKRLARLLDSNVDIVAISTRGPGTGEEGTVPQILACERRVMEHLRRNLPD
jgi:hypothetical protein